MCLCGCVHTYIGMHAGVCVYVCVGGNVCVCMGVFTHTHTYM